MHASLPFLVLFFIYLGYIALWQAIDEPTRAARAAALLAIVGFINVPIVKFSVDWWNTLHQPASVSRLARPALHADFLYPLLDNGRRIFIVVFGAHSDAHANGNIAAKIAPPFIKEKPHV